MVLVHNAIIRALNAIYLQAPHVKEEDVKDFLGFCYCWYTYIDSEFHINNHTIVHNIEFADPSEIIIAPKK